MRFRHLLGAAALAALGALPLAAEELPLGMTFAGETTSDRPARFELSVAEAGVLSIVVRAENDVSLAVYDSLDQFVPGGNLDIDFQGDYGAEQGAFVLGQPGDYVVIVMSLSSESAFQMGASWLPMDEVKIPEDPQGRPDTAAELTLNEDVFGEIDRNRGDILDWFRIEAPAEGRLTVGTRTRNQEDIVLTCFREGDYQNWIEHSDRDLQNDRGRERIVMDVNEGDVLYYKIHAYPAQADYAIRAVLETGDGELYGVEEGDEEGAEDTGDAAEDAAEDVLEDDVFEPAEDEIEDAVHDAADAIEDAVQDLVDSVDEIVEDREPREDGEEPFDPAGE